VVFRKNDGMDSIHEIIGGKASGGMGSRVIFGNALISYSRPVMMSVLPIIPTANAVN